MADPLLTSVAASLADANRDHRLPWHDDPAAFARECIAWPAGTELTPYQDAVLTSLATTGRVAVRSPHGAGKTTTAAIAVLWFATTRDAAGIDWKVVATAGAWRQLERYLWPEIRLWAGRIRWEKLNRKPLDTRTELLALNMKLAHGQAFAAASDDPQLLEGAHAASILLLLDEAKAIPADVWDAVEGALSGTGEALALATSTPGEPSGRFYDIHARKPGLTDWKPIHITLDDAVAAGRINPEWAEQRRRQWGEGSAVYANRVLGEFATSDEDGVVPLAWVEAAVERHRDWIDAGRPQMSVPLVIGVDVARSGADKTVLAMRRGPILESLERHRLEDTMETAGRVASALTHVSETAVVDVIGIGAGVVDRLREQHRRVIAFNASAGSSAHDRSGEMGFLNRRAEAWWGMRDLLDPATGSEVCLPDDDELIGDLTSAHWKLTSAGKIQVEAKSDIHRRLGRSPDAGDAVVMAFTAPAGVSVPVVRPYDGIPTTFDWRRQGWADADDMPNLDDPDAEGLPNGPWHPRGDFEAAGWHLRRGNWR